MRLLPALPALLLAGCVSAGTAATRAPPPAPPRVLTVDVAAQVGVARGPVGWDATAVLTAGVPAAVRPLHSGQCEPAHPAPAPGGESGPATLELAGPLAGPLTWDVGRQAWLSAPGNTTVDAGWAVSTLRWVDPDGVPREAADAVRFGAVPTVKLVHRRADGSVELRWDALSVDSVALTTDGPAGRMVCGADPDGAILPWWAVPALGGEVHLRSTRERVTLLENGLLVVVRAAIERIVPFDQPADWARELAVPPPTIFERPRGPRRSNRPPPPHLG